MQTSLEITKLCQSWWDTLADSTKAEQYRFAEQFLELLGWSDLTPIESKESWVQLARLSYLLRAGSTTVGAHFVMPGMLEPPASLLERGLDFCETTRKLVNATRTLHANYVFITDLHRSFLYDLRTDELLLHSDAPADFPREFGGVLSRTDVERGSLEEIRRQPRSEVARQLREWSERWNATLRAGSALSENDAYLVTDRLIVLRYLFAYDILRRQGWRLKKRFSNLLALAFSDNPRGCGRYLIGLFHDVWLDWKANLFAAAPALSEVLERDPIAAPLLREFALLSQTKFSIAAVLERFNYGDAAEKARVRMIPDANEEREAYLAKQTAATIDDVRIEVDLLDEGYRAIFHWFDKLVHLYDRLEIEFNAVVQNTPLPDDVDLFRWSEIDATRPDALGDKFHHVIQNGLVVYYESERQHRTARLLLYLHLINRYARAKVRFTQFPPIEMVLKPRPKFLESDRKRIFQAPPHDYDGEYEVI